MLIKGFSQEQSYSQIENWMIYLFFLLLFFMEVCTNASCTYKYFAYEHDHQLPAPHLIHEPYTYVHVLSYIGSLLNRCIWLLVVHTIK